MNPSKALKKSDKPGAKSPWDLASLIDLEVALTQERGLDDADLKRRDRAFYKRYREAGGPAGSRSRAFRAWVEERRRESTKNQASPGQEAQAWLRWIRSLGFIATFLLGSTWALATLTAHGAPVNVLTFWFLTIGIPLLLTGLGFYLMLGRKFPHLPESPLILKRLLARILISGVRQTEHLFTDRIGSARKLALRAGAGELRLRFSDRHGLISALLANTLHFLGLGMVLGIFAALFSFKCLSNQDYGWQSDAAYVKAERVEGFVRLISLPWTCLFGRDVGHPTTREICNTRFFRNEGVKGMDHTASINWSSFLVFSSLIWGVLPRGVLLMAGRMGSRRQLHAEDFGQHRFDALWRRLATPDISIEAPDWKEPHEVHAAVMESDNSQAQGPMYLLIPQEISSDKLRRNVIKRLEFQYGSSPSEFRNLPSLPKSRAALLDELVALADGGRMDLHILQESFMPYVREFRTLLMDSRAKLGAGASLRVVLIGVRTGDGTWAVASALDRSVWNDKLAAIGDPRISLLSLSPPENI